jgi:hypothetical protein
LAPWQRAHSSWRISLAGTVPVTAKRNRPRSAESSSKNSFIFSCRSGSSSQYTGSDAARMAEKITAAPRNRSSFGPSMISSS